MAGVKISALPGVGSALLTDFFPVVQAGVTSQETLSQVSTLFQTIMLPLTGGTMSGAIAMGTFKITGLGDPTAAQDAATKNYVDTFATGGGAPVVAASTLAFTVVYANGASGVGATLTNADVQATFALDGQSPTVGQRVLIKDQASTFQNGVYTVTNVGSGASNWILTRATDYNTPDTINDTGVIPVINGTVNANTGWVNTTRMVTVGTTALTFVQFGASFPISLANGGTNASLTASNGGIFYSTATAGAILAGTATANLPLLSGATAPPTWGSFALNLGGALTTAAAHVLSGAFASTFTFTGITSVTFPTSGTLATTANTLGGVAIQKFTATGTYTPNAKMVYCIIECIGGGGAGGGATSGAGNSGAAAGGGAGSYSRLLATAATIGASKAVTIGAGGTAGTAGNNPGNAGGDTSVGTLCIGKGGSGGGGAAAAGGGIAGAGGVAGTGDFTSVGATGFPGIGTTLLTVFALSGSGASGAYGGGGPGVAAAAGTTGAAGSLYGAGGGGSISWNAGGNTQGGPGAAGIVVITEYLTP